MRSKGLDIVDGVGRSILEELANQMKAFVVGKMCCRFAAQRFAIDVLWVISDSNVSMQHTAKRTCDIAVSMTLGVTAAPTIKVVRTMVEVACRRLIKTSQGCFRVWIEY